MTINEIPSLVKMIQKRDPMVHVFVAFEAGRDVNDFSVWLEKDSKDVADLGTCKYSVQQWSVVGVADMLLAMLEN